MNNRRLVFVCLIAAAFAALLFIEEVVDVAFAHPDSCVVVATSIAFGSVNAGAVELDTLVITCAADDTLLLNVAGLASPYSFISGDGADTLYQDSTATIIVQYAPTAAGAHLDTITLGDAECAAVPVSGTGLAASCALSDASIACGNIAVGGSYADTITITNDGGDTLAINVSGLSGDYSIDSGSGADTLLLDETASIIISFTPSSAKKVTEATDTLILGASECDSIILTATSYAPVTPSDHAKNMTSDDALNRMAKTSQWASQILYSGHDITVADTTFFSTSWSVSDGGRMFLQVYTAGVTHSGGEPLIIVKMVEEGRWYPLCIQSNTADPTDTLVVADDANYYRIWVATGFHATLKSDSGQSTVFGDSICTILIPDGATAGTYSATGRYKKE